MDLSVLGDRGALGDRISSREPADPVVPTVVRGGPADDREGGTEAAVDRENGSQAADGNERIVDGEWFVDGD